MTTQHGPGEARPGAARPGAARPAESRPGAADIARMIGAPPPTDEQVAVIEAPMRPLLVVAGAGSGKTETMSMRVLWLVVAQGVDPSAILGLTFTRKAAAELGSRLRDRLGRLEPLVPGLADAGEPVSLTYNSFAERIVTEHGLRIGIDPDVHLLGQAGAVQMMTDLVATWSRDLPLGGNPSPASVVRKALAMSGHLAEHDLSLPEARTELDRFGESLRGIGKPASTLAAAIGANDDRLALLDLVEAFDRRKRDAGVMDFSDQLALATRIVREAPDVVDQLRRDHGAVLLDEFQDTSVIQMELLSRLFRDHPVTAVGDPNQAIYGWRGASSASLETFLERFQSTSAEPDQTLTLSTAWRNDRRILDVANCVAAPLRTHAPRAPSPELVARPGAGRGTVDVAYTRDRPGQVEVVADFIQAHRRPRGSGVTSAAVLCRRRADFQAVDQALRERDIPTQVIGLGGLLDQPSVSDVRAALEVAVDVTNAPWLMRLLTNLDLGAADLRLLGDWSRHLARGRGSAEHPVGVLLDAVDTPPAPGWRPREGGPAFSAAGAARVRVLGQRLRAVRRGTGRGVVDQVERAVAIMGVAQDSVADPLLNTGRESLDAFADEAQRYESEAPGADMRGFLTWLAVAEDEEQGLAAPAVDPDPAAVQIMTIHGAKGLEWDAVAVVCLGDGAFPHHRSTPREWTEPPAGSSGWLARSDELPHPLRGDAASLPVWAPDLLLSGRGRVASFNKWAGGEYKELLGLHHEREERRLAYVALTRARSALLLTGSWVDTSRRLRPPSRYLMEPLTAGLTSTDPDTALTVPPTEEEVQEILGSSERETFPTAPGRSRELITASAARVLGRARQIADSGAGTAQVLSTLGPDPLVEDVEALLEERRLARERHGLVVTPGRLPATSVSRLLQDPGAFALDLRRPLPEEPLESSALGTLFHAWVERQLRQTSGELWDEPMPGEEALSPRDRERLDAMRAHFPALEILRQTPVAVEEPFAVEVGGVPVQGRIDAVFRDDRGRDTVVDWKSGMVPDDSTDPTKLQYFLTQLRLYRTAWARRTGVPEDAVQAIVAFLAAPRLYTLEELEQLGGGAGSVGGSLDDAVGHALSSSRSAGTRKDA